MTVTIIEKGNGFPNVGEMVYDANNDVVYRITGGGTRIHTAGPGAGNYMPNVEVEEIGDASDLTEEEFENEIASCGVTCE